jgi:hypothetical protein
MTNHAAAADLVKKLPATDAMAASSKIFTMATRKRERAGDQYLTHCTYVQVRTYVFVNALFLGTSSKCRAWYVRAEVA